MKIIILITAAIIYSTGITLAQDPARTAIPSARSIPARNPGGEQVLQKFVLGFRYSEEMVKNRVKGDVIVSMDVNTNGTLSNFKVDKDLGFGTAEEALRLMGTSFKWVPAIENGLLAKSRVSITIPVDAKANPVSRTVVSQKTTVVSRGMNADTNRVVYDDQGNALRYYQYWPMLRSGEYSILTNGDPDLPETKSFLRKIDPARRTQGLNSARMMMSVKNDLLQENSVLNTFPLSKALGKSYLDHKIFILVFWRSDCPPCTQSFENFNSYLKDINPHELILMAITPDDKINAEATLTKTPLLNARLISNAQQIIKEYGITTYPAYVITDKERVIRLAINGYGPYTLPIVKNAIQEITQP